MKFEGFSFQEKISEKKNESMSQGHLYRIFFRKKKTSQKCVHFLVVAKLGASCSGYCIGPWSDLTSILVRQVQCFAIAFGV